MEATKRTDQQLLVDAREDPEAFAAFYRRHAEAVLAYLLYRTRDPEQALDLTAETFAIALAGHGKFRPARGPARGWIFGIAKNVLLDSQRRAATADRTRRKLQMERLSFEDVELERVEVLIDLQSADAPLMQLVGELAPEQRQAVLARIIDERDYPEISADLGVTEHTVRQRVSRGIARLTKLHERRSNA